MLSEYSGFLNARDRISKFYFTKSINDKEIFSQISIPTGVYELEILNDEMKRIFIEERPFAEKIYPLTSKPRFSKLLSLTEFSRSELLISFMPDHCLRDILCFNADTLYNKFILSPNPVDVLSFGNIFLEFDITQGIIFD